MSKYRSRGGTWVSDAEQEILNKQRYEQQKERGLKVKKSTVPAGFTKYTNLTTGVELLIDHEAYLGNIKKLNDVDLILEDVIRVYESSDKVNHGAYELAITIREVINE